MKRSIAVLCACTLMFIVGNVLAQDKTGKTDKDKKAAAKEMTVKGEVVDVSCYLAHGDKGKGESHASCAEACAKNGGPLGILTNDGTLYVSVLPDDHSAGPNAKLIDHIGHHVEATGMLRTKGGVNGMMISKVAMEKTESKEK